MNGPTNSKGQSAAANSFHHNSFPQGKPHQLPEESRDETSPAATSEVNSAARLDGKWTRTPCPSVRQRVVLPVLLLNALMRMRFGSTGHVDVQSWHWEQLCSIRHNQALNSLIHCVYHAFALAGWTGWEGGDKNWCPQGCECRAVLVTQDTRRFTGQIQTTNVPLKHLHQQCPSPSAQLILLQFPKPVHSPSASLFVSSPQKSLQATGTKKKSKYTGRCRTVGRRTATFLLLWKY